MFELHRTLKTPSCGTGVEFILPTDVIIADKFDENAESKVVAVDAIPDGWMVRHPTILETQIQSTTLCIFVYEFSLMSQNRFA